MPLNPTVLATHIVLLWVVPVPWGVVLGLQGGLDGLCQGALT